MAEVPKGRPDRGQRIIHLPVEEAKKRRWEAGVRKYGPVFYLDPMEEAFDEAIDLMNYAEEATRHGYDPHLCSHIRALASLAAQAIKDTYTDAHPSNPTI